MTLREPQRRTLRGNSSRPRKHRPFSDRAADCFEWVIGMIENIVGIAIVLILGFIVKCLLPFLLMLVVAIPAAIVMSPFIVVGLAYQAGLWETVLYLISVCLVLVVLYAAAASDNRNFVSRGRKLTNVEEARKRANTPGAHRGLRQPKQRS